MFGGKRERAQDKAWEKEKKRRIVLYSHMALKGCANMVSPDDIEEPR